MARTRKAGAAGAGEDVSTGAAHSHEGEAVLPAPVATETAASQLYEARGQHYAAVLDELITQSHRLAMETYALLASAGPLAPGRARKISMALKLSNAAGEMILISNRHQKALKDS